MPLRDILLALLIPLLWGSAFTLAKPASEHFPPMFMLTAIYAVCGLGLTVVYGVRHATPIGAALLLALVAGAGQAFLLFLGLAGLDASIAVLLLQSQVPFAVMASVVINGERILPLRMIGIAIALAGVAAVVGLPAQAPPLVPLLLVLVGAAMWGVGQALIKRLSRDDAPNTFRVISLYSVPMLLVSTLALEHGQIASIGSAGPAEWGSLLLLTLGGMAIGNSLWYFLLKRQRVDEVSPFLLLMPIVGVGTGALVLGETITMAHFVGGALVLIGLAIVVGLPRRRKPSIESA